jgi:hypothetical protein
MDPDSVVTEEDDLSLTLLERFQRQARRPASTKRAAPLPVGLPTILSTQLPVATPSAPPSQPSRSLSLSLSTASNVFGLSRHYFSKTLPSHDPEMDLTPKDLADGPSEVPQADLTLGPYPNLSSLRLGDWYWSSDQKSQQDFKLLTSIVGDESFRPEDIRATPWDKINAALASSDYEKQQWLEDTAGWVDGSVTITVPFHIRRVAARDPAQIGAPRPYQVKGFRYRKLLSVIKERLTNSSTHPYFHYEPFELRWTHPDHPHGSVGMRVYGEIYTSDAFLQAHRDLQGSPPIPDCSLPRVIAALMFWSDATQLTNFSDAKLHPLYLFFGNESKYRRSRPSAQASSHVAYFCTVGRPLPPVGKITDLSR